MAFNVPQLTQASFLQKNQMLQNVFFDICNTEKSQGMLGVDSQRPKELMVSPRTTGGQVKAPGMTGVNRESLMNDRCGKRNTKGMTGLGR